MTILRSTAAFGLILGLAACDTGVMSGDETAAAMPAPTSMAAARPVVGPIVAKQVPGEPGAALTECILENATEAELARISVANAGAPEADIVLLVSDILGRDATVACAAARLS